jgi:hypothetical protein
MSYTWRSIFRGLELLKHGVFCHIGSGDGGCVQGPLDPEKFYTLAMHTNGMDERMKVADLVNEH